MINYDIPVNYRMQNALIKGHILDEKTMNSNGLYKYDNWYLMKNLGNEISLTIVISQEDITIRIMVSHMIIKCILKIIQNYTVHLIYIIRYNK